MIKAKIKIEINDYIIQKEGIIDNDIIFLEDKNEKIEFNLQKMILIKENNELIINMDFKNKTIIYELVQENKKINDIFEVISLTNSNKQVIINYRIDNTDFLLKLEYETI